MTNAIIPQNRLKRTLREGGTAVGTMLVEIRQPAVMQLLANAGFDFVLIDNEHGPFSVETIADLSREARRLGITPLVRVPEITYTHLTQALDAGAQGIMAPRITEPAQVHEVLQMMKYSPEGRRGAVLSRGHTEFRAGPLEETLAIANRESMLVVQVETRQAVENLEQIVSISGVDAALIGPTDLSLALGVPGDLNNAELHAAIESTIEVCSRYGVTPAIHMNDLTQAVLWAGRGMRMISYNSEAGLLMNAGQNAAGAVREAFAGSRR